MPYFTTTFTTGANSTTPGASPAANLNWLGGKPTTISLTFTSSTANNDVTIQYSLDDVQRVTSTGVVWASLSSGGITATRHRRSTSPRPLGLTTHSRRKS
jgi:hypothetical protein